MILRELFEAATIVWGKSGSKMVRKYRCTSGQRKGRVVAKASTCSAPINVSKSANFKKTRRKLAAPMAIKSNRTKRAYKVSRRVKRLNKGLKTR